MTRPDLETNDSTQDRSGFAHIAFSTGFKDAVLALTQQLQNDGFPVVSTPGTTGDGYFKSCVLDGEGNRIEITV